MLVVWLGSRVNGVGLLPDPWRVNKRTHRANVDDGAFGFEEKRHERLGNAQDPPEVHIKYLLPHLNVDICNWNGVAGAGIVDKVVKRAACFSLDSFDGSIDQCRRSHVEGKDLDVWKRGKGGWNPRDITCSREDSEVL